MQFSCRRRWVLIWILILVLVFVLPNLETIHLLYNSNNTLNPFRNETLSKFESTTVMLKRVHSKTVVITKQPKPELPAAVQSNPYANTSVGDSSQLRTDAPVTLGKSISEETITALFNATTSEATGDAHRQPLQQRPRSVIFYNIYSHQEQQGRNGMRVLLVHTKQIAAHLLAARRPQSPAEPLPHFYYNMIGYNHTDPFCPNNMTCQFLNFYEHAFEDVTLQDAYQYCIHHPQDIIYYLHNKGSFTASKLNERWRRHVTKHLLTPESIALLETDSSVVDSTTSCNVVGAAWHAFPYWHFPANFWMAKCSYVQKLIPPKDFHDAMATRVVEPLLHPNHLTPESPYYCLAAFFHNYSNINYATKTVKDMSLDFQNEVAMGRYCYEHWISSHPDVVPCYTRGASVFHSNVQTALKAENYKHEWFRMHGRLYEMFQLYQRLPSNASFFWKYFQGTESPLEPLVCQQGQGRNLSAYYDNLTFS